MGKNTFRSVIIDSFEIVNLAYLVEDIDEEIRAKMTFVQRDYESQGTKRLEILTI